MMAKMMKKKGTCLPLPRDPITLSSYIQSENSFLSTKHASPIAQFQIHQPMSVQNPVDIPATKEVSRVINKKSKEKVEGLARQVR